MDILTIKNEFLFFAQKINVPEKYWPEFGNSKFGSGPVVELGPHNQLLYIHYDRGEEVEKEYAVDLDDLMYRIFNYITFAMSSDYESKHRKENEDSRRQKISIQEKLLGELSQVWKDRCHRENLYILKNYPFDDLSQKRINYSIELKNTGMSSQDAWANAVKKFPLPINI